MEPVEVDTFHGRWSQALPDARRIRVAPAPASRHAEILDLTVTRLPRVSRAEAAWVFESSDLFRGLVVEEALVARDQVVGWGMVGHPSFLPDNRSFIRAVVARGSEGRGVGRALFASLLPQLPPGTTLAVTGVFDDEPRSWEIARHWGFVLEEHAIDSQLDLTVLPAVEPPAGVTLHEVAQLDFEDRDAVERMLLASQTNPEARAGIVFDLDRLASTVGPREHPVCVIARARDTPAGITFGGVVDGTLHIVYSGVDPAFRGRGLMRLVKQQAHLTARAAGATLSKTNNEEHNTGIRRVNAELGYVVTSGVYRLVRDLTRL